MPQNIRPVWVLLDGVTGHKQTWTYMVLHDEPYSQGFGQLSQEDKIRLDSPSKHFTYETLCKDLQECGIPADLIPTSEYFEPDASEQESKSGEITRRVPEANTP